MAPFVPLYGVIVTMTGNRPGASGRRTTAFSITPSDICTGTCWSTATPYCAGRSYVVHADGDAACVAVVPRDVSSAVAVTAAAHRAARRMAIGYPFLEAAFAKPASSCCL